MRVWPIAFTSSSSFWSCFVILPTSCFVHHQEMQRATSSTCVGNRCLAGRCRKKPLEVLKSKAQKYGVLDMLDASKGESWIFQHSRESAPLKKEVGVITLNFWHLDVFHKKQANFLEVDIHWRLRCPSSCLSELPYFNALEPPEIAGCVPYKSLYTVW